MRKISFAIDEFYHIYNRGVEKRNIFEKPEDVIRFLKSMDEFNSVKTIGSIYENSFILGSSTPKLVSFVAFCLNQNHYHFILSPLVENGIQKFMHRLSTGYTNYFNDQYKRSGSLFQGRYKATHVNSNEYLLHLSVYVNFNNKVHKNLNKEWMNKLHFSSFNEYISNNKTSFCDKGIILEQFKNTEDYKNFCLSTLPVILKRKEEEKELKSLLLD